MAKFEGEFSLALCVLLINFHPLSMKLVKIFFPQKHIFFFSFTHTLGNLKITKYKEFNIYMLTIFNFLKKQCLHHLFLCITAPPEWIKVLFFSYILMKRIIILFKIGTLSFCNLFSCYVEFHQENSLVSPPTDAQSCCGSATGTTLVFHSTRPTGILPGWESSTYGTYTPAAPKAFQGACGHGSQELLSRSSSSMWTPPWECCAVHTLVIRYQACSPSLSSLLTLYRRHLSPCLNLSLAHCILKPSSILNLSEAK